MAQYQIRLKSGLYVGLFNFGRTYKPCKSAAWLNIESDDVAMHVAKSFDSETLTKRTLEYVVVCNFDYGEGTEVVCWCKDKTDAKDTAQRYNENDRQHYYRITRKWLETSIKVVQAA